MTKTVARTAIILILFLLGLVGLFLLLPGVALATENGQTGPPPDFVTMSNAECLACHETPNMVMPLANGEELFLTVDRIQYATSVHGRNGYACVQCHTDISGYPHPELAVETARQFTGLMVQSCQNCHEDAADQYSMGRHAQAQAAGVEEAALCSDCHGSHNLKELGGSRTQIAETCRQCHADIYDFYKESVHGTALLEDFNVDVPNCIDCHDYHNNRGPRDPGFHLFSPQICADCHADEDLMAKYEVNTDVFETFVADFHGTTVVIFEQTAPDQETNKAVCIDCHGVHDIRAATDENSTIIKQNLITTCERCHPGAPPDFSDAWLSHYRPDLRNNTIVFLVNLFYWIVIPGTMGGILLFISTDFWRRRQNNSSEGPEA